ncbi:MAG: carboxy-terminal-processing protease, carboxyl-terminal processing protease [Candidatus Peregrinibacteria bacterium GW2011_GWE2_39_6]|nr:MAG: carboxy-terminal-processing protease, carboxyl-terminal processing protease [Candidatus Peregrinibacteria bacterium GW2011_GWF2_39_17]KKR26376.1 MAG: carboxy-terminal-processing protease, carboxyl-terminal processing protease [Candidatus Peregrinibacteria bacterium GW2011_GWE2_39_6]HCW32524.1 S41 family peptidase [Candidatus Peregrinibacteria bacterium]
MRFSRNARSGLSIIFIFGLGIFLGWGITLYYVQDQLQKPLPTSSSGDNELTPLKMDLFWEVYDQIANQYFDKSSINSENQLYGSIKGLVNSLQDPHSTFMTPQENQDFQNNLEGTLKGIGAELTMENDNLTVMAPLKGSPAELAGLKAEDVIYKIDNTFVADLNLFEAIMKIRGEAGTKVTLTIIREGIADPFELTIERAEINVPSVEIKYYGANENLAYVSIYQFNENTASEFDKVIQELLLKPVQGLILDLRYNGGGYLDVSIDILSEFLEGKKVAVVTKHRHESDNEIFYTNESARLVNLPLVVLVNEGSASASEIVAGAIQDYKRGIIMGTQTFGKGSVQTVEVLEDGSSLRLTIAKWHTPNDRSIDEVGITPDTIVKISDEDAANNIDTQLNSAVDYLEKLRKRFLER